MRIPLLLLSALTLFSCKKEVQRSSSIELGDETGLEVTYSSRDISGDYFIPDHFDLDLDNDGVFDVRLNSSSNYSDILGFSPDANIEPLSTSFHVLIDKVPDSIFVHHSIQFTTNQSNEQIAIESTTYSCEREEPFSQVFETQEMFVPAPKTKGEVIALTDSYRSELVYFARPNEAVFESTGFVDQGVSYYSFIVHLRDCMEYPQGVYKYIGFKMTSADGTRLGWLKMSVQGSRIKMNSWAIQK